MRLRFLTFLKRKSALDRQERERALALDTQGVHAVRKARERATINGLLARSTPEARASYKAKMAAVQAVLDARGGA
jgi:hypothetical protein